MRPPRLHFVLAALLAAAAVVVLAHTGTLGDYPVDAGPAIGAVIDGHVGYALSHQPLMGSLAVIARLPFAFGAKLLGAGELGVYRAGALPCLAALALLGALLVRLRRDASTATMLLVPALAVLTPASFAAVRNGHPEEALAAAFAVAAVALAGRRALVAGVLLGLALATKQWAVLAVAPAVLAAPRGLRLKLLGLSLGVAALLTLPLVAADPGSFFSGAHAAAGAEATASRETIWLLAAHPTRIPLHLGPGFPSTLTMYRLDSWVPALSHPLIVLVSPLLTLLAWRRRPLQPGDALGLLALVFLLRCVLDPSDNAYYHLPFLASLLAYETVARRREVPLLTLAASAGLWLTANVLDAHAAAPPLTNAVYLLWSLPLAAYLAQAIGRPRRTPRIAVPVFAALARQRA